MKGFPNQIAELPRLAQAMGVLKQLVDTHQRAKDYAVFGEALVRVGVLGTGHRPIPVEDYLRLQRAKSADSQTIQTTPRGLRELFRLLSFIDDSGEDLVLLPLGEQAAGYANQPMDAGQTAFWRRSISAMQHFGGDPEASHPYQVLLRLIARKPGITRSLCPLALEARNDSDAELERIVLLADLSEDDARTSILISRTGQPVSQTNWDNAKKILPRFAEQLGDVIRLNDSYTLAVAPGEAIHPAPVGAPLPVRDRVPRTARAATAATIARANVHEEFDEITIPPSADPERVAAAAATRADRFRRHQQLVTSLATLLEGHGRHLYADPFDILAVIDELAILVEAKTLDGSEEDERERVRDALSQLLYYEAFVAKPVAGVGVTRKIACFESALSPEHREWLNQSSIGVVWLEGNGFRGDILAQTFVGAYIEEIRGDGQ
jgi:hypothetical protein